MAGDYVEFGELAEATSASGSDELLLQQAGGTKRIKKDNFTSDFVNKNDIADKVEKDNMNPVASNAVNSKLEDYVKTADIVDKVESGNMNAVTSNAVQKVINTIGEIKDATNGYDGNIGHNNIALFVLELEEGCYNLSGSFRIMQNQNNHALILSLGVNGYIRQMGVIYENAGSQFFSINTYVNSKQTISIYLQNYDITSDTVTVASQPSFFNAIKIK